uniref:Uncharacterized protein n=1 Tax=Haptolina ericina TaxID=156174 RepID=A0A7S3BH07_9EUKA
MPAAEQDGDETLEILLQLAGPPASYTAEQRAEMAVSVTEALGVAASAVSLDCWFLNAAGSSTLVTVQVRASAAATPSTLLVMKQQLGSAEAAAATLSAYGGVVVVESVPVAPAALRTAPQPQQPEAHSAPCSAAPYPLLLLLSACGVVAALPMIIVACAGKDECEEPILWPGVVLLTLSAALALAACIIYRRQSDSPMHVESQSHV